MDSAMAIRKETYSEGKLFMNFILYNLTADNSCDGGLPRRRPFFKFCNSAHYGARRHGRRTACASMPSVLSGVYRERSACSLCV